MKHLASLGEMALELALIVPEVALELHHGLEKVAQRIEATAKSEFGVYQAEQGAFPAWPELAEATKDDRVRQGYTENDPLLRSGELMNTVGHEVQGLEAAIGSTDEKMVFHEFGTSRMPARPVLGPAAFRNKAAIQKLVGAAVVAGLIGTDQVHAALGYDFTTKD